MKRPEYRIPSPRDPVISPLNLGIQIVPEATLRTEVYDKKLITDTDIFSPPSTKPYTTMADDFDSGNLFQDPEGYYPEEEPPTFAEHTMLSGQKVRVRLVGSHPLYV